MRRIERLRPRLEAGRQLCEYDERLGFRVDADALQRGEAVITADVDARWHNPEATAHGGVVAGLADTAMGLTMYLLLDEDTGCTNIDLNVKFLRPVTTGRLRAEGTVLKEGRTLCLVEAHIRDEQDRLVARADSTFMKLPGRPVPEESRAV